VVPNARPTVLVQTEKTLPRGDEFVRVRYYGPSHADGDLSVYFKKADVLFTGDTWWNGLYPFIDYVAGGSIDGMIRAANTNIELSGEHTVVVPGHGPMGPVGISSEHLGAMDLRQRPTPATTLNIA